MAAELQLVGGGACCLTPPTIVPTRPLVDPSFVRQTESGAAHIDFLVPQMHCAGCLKRIESSLLALPGVSAARANLTTRRVGVDFLSGRAEPDAMLRAIEDVGYACRPFDAASFDKAEDEVQTELMRSMAVAGFAAGNIMLLSVSVWAGADAATRDLFHWLSALIALPAIIYAGRPFFRSAARGLRAGRLNMDFPISLGVGLASAMSLYETMLGGEHAWFDASITLLFLLLVGRFLDHRMRDVARSAASRLLSLAARSAMRVDGNGAVEHVPIGEISAGDVVLVAAGERIPVDGTIVSGLSEVDGSFLTGEAQPEPVGPASAVFAGTMNLTGPLTVRTSAGAKDTLLADIVRLTETAERGDSRLVRLADRASALYAPAVHVLAFGTFAGWLLSGADLHAALTAAVAVLIITCPCALGLAVPAVQVVAGGFLLRRGIMLKEGSALERLAGVDTVVFDKTGTLTLGEPVLVEARDADVISWSVAAALGQSSRHPLAKALAAAACERGVRLAEIANPTEHPGFGIEGLFGGTPVKLGRSDWVGGAVAGEDERLEIWLRIGEARPTSFRFVDEVRPDAAAVIAEIKAAGLGVSLLSGDRASAVAPLAAGLGIGDWTARLRPGDKAARVADARAAGAKVLMVGDGMNDAPALASAFVSMSPSTGSDITQTAAALVFTGRNLAPVAIALKVARSARRLILQNFVLAIGYNAIAVPVAMFGHATPLIAAVAMSTSSILVTVNALRLPTLLRPAGRAARQRREAMA